MKAQERLYLTADRNVLVGHNSPKAAFLYAAQGDDIPASAADKFGLVDGRLKPGKVAKQAAPPAEPKAPAKSKAPARSRASAKPKATPAKVEKTPPADKEQAPAEDKEQKPGENKGG